MGPSDQAPIILGSSSIGDAVAALEVSRVLFVPTAANGLSDRDAIVATYRDQLTDLDLEIVDVDLDDPAPPHAHAPAPIDAVCCSGGDPYHLLAAIRRSGFDRHLADLRDAGAAYVGASAGALVAGPSLDPVERVTPFARPAGLDTTALGLTRTVTLPHDDRPGRRDAHADAQSTHGRDRHMIAITDTETLRVGDPRWWLTDHASGRVIRPARVDDASGIARCHLDAGRAAWTFLDADRFAAMDPQTATWADRVAEVGDPDLFLVAEEDGGTVGFVRARTIDDGATGVVGEVEALYTRPAVWGSGAGRRLLDQALDRLRAKGCGRAVLYTEERNARARRLYERLGWSTDGAARERRFLDTPIHEVRYTRTL